MPSSKEEWEEKHKDVIGKYLIFQIMSEDIIMKYVCTLKLFLVRISCTIIKKTVYYVFCILEIFDKGKYLFIARSDLGERQRPNITRIQRGMD